MWKGQQRLHDSLIKKPRYISKDGSGCTTCVEYCPVEIPDPFNQELSSNKAVHIYFSQAVPLVPYIDREMHLPRGTEVLDLRRRV